MATLSNSQIKTLVNTAYAQATGSTNIETQLDLSAFTDTGADATALKENFTKALLGVIAKNWFLDSSYRSEYSDPYFEDYEKFGAITQAISIIAPTVKDNTAWDSFVNGSSTIGTYVVNIPEVQATTFSKSVSWAIPVTITNEQWNTAFHSESELNTFVATIFMVIDNALLQHMEDLNAANRNNFIATKYNFQTTVNKGVQVFDLVKSYVKDKSISTALTVEQFLNNSECLKYSIEQLQLYMGYLTKQSSLFNMAGVVRFVPKDRLVVEMLDYFEKRLTVLEISNTFHDDLVALPLHRTVPCWQSMADLSFDGLSSINVKTADGDIVKLSGIVAIMGDKWAMAHTIKSDRVGAKYFDIEALTQYEFQHKDMYMNLDMNSVVFILSDYTPA